jgi:uncharacterized protein YrrD
MESRKSIPTPFRKVELSPTTILGEWLQKPSAVSKDSCSILATIPGSGESLKALFSDSIVIYEMQEMFKIRSNQHQEILGLIENSYYDVQDVDPPSIT